MNPQGIEAVLAGKEGQPQHLIEVLLDVQEKEGFVSREAINTIAQRLSVPLIEAYRVASFYKVFSLQPRGRHLATICMGTACHVRGASQLLDEARAQLGIEPGRTTTDGEFSVQRVNCLGACALGPIMVLDGTYHDHTSPAKLRKLIRGRAKTKKGGNGR
jgi:NADH-quinone oxidoreductase subunit E